MQHYYEKQAEEIHFSGSLLPVFSLIYFIFPLVCTNRHKLFHTTISRIIVHLFRMELSTVPSPARISTWKPGARSRMD